MASAGFTLAERLGAKSLPCTVPGCARTWISLGGAGKTLKLGGRAAPEPGDAGSAMCDPCRTKFTALGDAQRACDRPGCSGTWTWPVMAQMTAFATKQQPPVNLCGDCEQKLAALEDKAIPCSVTGCARSSVFTRRAQLLGGAPDVDPTPGATMCGPCDGVFKKLKDRQVSCGINGCKHKWLWSADEQIQAYATGKPNEPPRRMCDECKTVFGAIADREVRCRTSGCKKTWTWNRGDQLDACLAGKGVPKAPARMCPSCLDIYSRVKDVERPCRRSTCKRTWTDKRGAQLARAVRGKTGDPYPHYCPECEKELGELEDRQVACKTDNCPGTWTWTSAQQLAAGVRPVVKGEAGADKSAEKLEGRHGNEQGGRNGNARAQGQGKLAHANHDGGHAHDHGAQADDDHAHAHDDAAHAEGDHAHAHDETAHAHDDGAHAEGDVAASVHADGEAAGEAGVETAATALVPTAGGGRKGRNRNRNRKRRREPRPPERRCEACIEFLKDRKTHEIPCSVCATPIYWPPESQLQTHLGNWSEPSLCGACKRDATEAARAAQREALRHPPMPNAAEPAPPIAPEATEPAAQPQAPEA